MGSTMKASVSQPDSVDELFTELRKQLGLEGSAHFLAELHDGFLPDEVIADFYRVADALFFPSREEGFGIPLIEAAFSHLPAFCADIPPLRKLGLSDAQFFLPDEDPARISNMLADYFQTSLPARLAMRARGQDEERDVVLALLGEDIAGERATMKVADFKQWGHRFLATSFGGRGARGERTGAATGGAVRG